jgi:hypothetical protein
MYTPLSTLQTWCEHNIMGEVFKAFKPSPECHFVERYIRLVIRYILGLEDLK